MNVELTNEQIEATLNAQIILDAWNPAEVEIGKDEWNYYLSDVSGVGDTITEFVSHNGLATQFTVLERLGGFKGYLWEDVQSSKGKRRGSLYVVDFGDVRGCIFTGQV